MEIPETHQRDIAVTPNGEPNIAKNRYSMGASAPSLVAPIPFGPALQPYMHCS